MVYRIYVDMNMISCVGYKISCMGYKLSYIRNKISYIAYKISHKQVKSHILCKISDKMYKISILHNLDILYVISDI